jgi:hypothetical protein
MFELAQCVLHGGARCRELCGEGGLRGQAVVDGVCPAGDLSANMGAYPLIERGIPRLSGSVIFNRVPRH